MSKGVLKTILKFDMARSYFLLGKVKFDGRRRRDDKQVACGVK
jgi:hypothetical protein